MAVSFFSTTMPFAKPFTGKGFTNEHKQKVSENGHFLFDSVHPPGPHLFFQSFQISRFVITPITSPAPEIPASTAVHYYPSVASL